MPQKRSQPVSAPASKGSGKYSKTSKAKGNAASSVDANPASNSPPTPALTPSSSSTPPSSLTPLYLARSSKKLTKAVRQGHHHGNGGHGGHSAGGGKGAMKTRRAVGDGPEAELSGEEEEDGASVVEEDPSVGDVGGKNASKSEVSMCALLDGAKVRPEPHSISRGYELLTSPASRLVIPFDSIPSVTPKKPFATRTGTIFGGAGYGVSSTPSSPGFSDDVEWEWEDLCFEMDAVDLTAGVTAVMGRKDAYAEVVKRATV